MTCGAAAELDLQAPAGNGGESGRRSVPALRPAAIAAVSRTRLHIPVGRVLRSVFTRSGSPSPAGAEGGGLPSPGEPPVGKAPGDVRRLPRLGTARCRPHRHRPL